MAGDDGGVFADEPLAGDGEGTETVRDGEASGLEERVSRTGSGFGVWGRCERLGTATWGASAGGGTARGVEGAGN